MQEILKFKELHFIEDFKEINSERLRTHGSDAELLTPTTVDIYPYVDVIHIVLNGDRHHSSYSIPVTFDDKKYRRIYKSFKKVGVNLTPFITKKILVPETFKSKEHDLDSMSKEDLIKYIKSGKTYYRDENFYFDPSIFDVRYVGFPTWCDYFGGKTYSTQNWYAPANLISIFNDDYNEFIRVNKEGLQELLKKSQFDVLYKLEVEKHYLTDEISAFRVVFRGNRINESQLQPRKVLEEIQ
jgi:hypothetical protein